MFKKFIMVITLLIAIIGIFGGQNHAYASTIHHTAHHTTFHAKKYKPLTLRHKKIHRSYVRKVSIKSHKHK